MNPALVTVDLAVILHLVLLSFPARTVLIQYETSEPSQLNIPVTMLLGFLEYQHEQAEHKIYNM